MKSGPGTGDIGRDRESDTTQMSSSNVRMNWRGPMDSAGRTWLQTSPLCGLQTCFRSLQGKRRNKPTNNRDGRLRSEGSSWGLSLQRQKMYQQKHEVPAGQEGSGESSRSFRHGTAMGWLAQSCSSKWHRKQKYYVVQHSGEMSPQRCTLIPMFKLKTRQRYQAARGGKQAAAGLHPRSAVSQDECVTTAHKRSQDVSTREGKTIWVNRQHRNKTRRTLKDF